MYEIHFVRCWVASPKTQRYWCSAIWTGILGLCAEGACIHVHVINHDSYLYKLGINASLISDPERQRPVTMVTNLANLLLKAVHNFKGLLGTALGNWNALAIC